MVAIFRSVRKVQWAINFWSKETIRPTSTRCTSMFTGMNFAFNYVTQLRKTRLDQEFRSPVPSLAFVQNYPTFCLLRLLISFYWTNNYYKTLQVTKRNQLIVFTRKSINYAFCNTLSYNTSNIDWNTSNKHTLKRKGK